MMIHTFKTYLTYFAHISAEISYRWHIFQLTRLRSQVEYKLSCIYYFSIFKELHVIDGNPQLIFVKSSYNIEVCIFTLECICCWELSIFYLVFNDFYFMSIYYVRR